MKFLKFVFNLLLDVFIDICVIYVGILFIYYFIIPCLPILVFLGIIAIPFIILYMFRLSVPHNTSFKK
jgi:hypothetical protein